MRRKRIKLSSKHQRSVVSDTLPFEVPPSFTNRHFCDFLIRFNVRLENSEIVWDADDDAVDVIIRMFGGVSANVAVEPGAISRSGSIRNIRKLRVESNSFITMPFQFDITHKEKESRRLTVPHPLNQLAVAKFYQMHASSITYYAGLSPFSIRKPTRIARYANHRDRTHVRMLAVQDGQIEEIGREYDQIGSFFVYESYSNVFKFFESYQYHRAEKRFNAMAKVDISKCFDSIYTHSLAWAVHGTRPVKDALAASNTTFAARFDILMRSLNQNETNGIVIGPEFSRVFAELILQAVDVQLEKKLRSSHKLLHRHDYEIFRYVDDYYIFYNEKSQSEIVFDNLRHILANFKLHINASKTVVYEKPIITEITVAKNAISALIAESIVPSAGSAVANDSIEDIPTDEAAKHYNCRVNSRDLIIQYKIVLKTSGVSYLDVGNYTFALVEAAVDKVLSKFVASPEDFRDAEVLTNALVSIMEFLFFIYSSAPRVNLSIRLARIITTIASALRKTRLPAEMRHHFFKYVYDNISHQLRKNQSAEFKELEQLYLLQAIGSIGKEYWLEERMIRRHFHIDGELRADYVAKNGIGYFTTVVLLSYMRDKARYADLRDFIVEQALAKIVSRKHYRYRDAEILMLSMDLLVCPYLTQTQRSRIAEVYELSASDLQSFLRVTRNWFTTWNGAGIATELDAKRLREVY